MLDGPSELIQELARTWPRRRRTFQGEGKHSDISGKKFVNVLDLMSSSGLNGVSVNIAPTYPNRLPFQLFNHWNMFMTNCDVRRHSMRNNGMPPSICFFGLSSAFGIHNCANNASYCSSLECVTGNSSNLGPNFNFLRKIFISCIFPHVFIRSDFLCDR